MKNLPYINIQEKDGWLLTDCNTALVSETGSYRLIPEEQYYFWVEESNVCFSERALFKSFLSFEILGHCRK